MQDGEFFLHILGTGIGRGGGFLHFWGIEGVERGVAWKVGISGSFGEEGCVVSVPAGAIAGVDTSLFFHI